ncbi:MAG: nuclear transport factor 2 family protein [Solirubrobacteraceae bacterium]
MSNPCVAELWQVGDLRSLALLLADDVTFSSPVADYHGRADAAHLLTLIPSVVDDLALGDPALAGGVRFTSLSASVDGHPLEGLLREREDEQGKLAHVTLFLRPYHSLKIAIQAMGQRLAEAPLPSTRPADGG